MTLALTFAVGLSVTGYRIASHNPACGRLGSETDLAKDSYTASYMKAWTNPDDCRVRRDVLALRESPCTTGIREIMFGSPLGRPMTPHTTQIYVRDPAGRYGDGPLRLDVELPVGARDTGYRLGESGLWTLLGDDSFVFVVTNGSVEAWPRGHGPTCA